MYIQTDSHPIQTEKTTPNGCGQRVKKVYVIPRVVLRAANLK